LCAGPGNATNGEAVIFALLRSAVGATLSFIFEPDVSESGAYSKIGGKAAITPKVFIADAPVENIDARGATRAQVSSIGIPVDPQPNLVLAAAAKGLGTLKLVIDPNGAIVIPESIRCGEVGGDAHFGGIDHTS
jgi:hypothetical protein